MKLLINNNQQLNLDKVQQKPPLHTVFVTTLREEKQFDFEVKQTTQHIKQQQVKRLIKAKTNCLKITKSFKFKICGFNGRLSLNSAGTSMLF